MVRCLEWPFICFAEETVEDRATGRSCLTESEIEDLARGKLSGEIEQRCLAHLLWCQSCQQRVNEETEFAQATRTAAVLLERKQRASAELRQHAGWFGQVLDRFRNSFRASVSARWAVTAASVCALAFLTFLLPVWRTPEGSEVFLRSERGSVTPATAESVSGGKLRLRIDVADVEPYPAYKVSVVDAVGNAIEASMVSAAAGYANVTLHRQLSPGGYWIRLAAPDGRLLREYALRVRP